jgi:hypothetical protein
MGEESSAVVCKKEMDEGRKFENVTGNAIQEFDLRIKRR